MQETVLELKNYSVSFDTPDGEVQAVRNVDLTVKKGEILCIVGESGCGKTVMCRSVMKLLPPNAHVKSGEISLCGENITAYKRKKMEKLCGSKVSMVFQDPMLTLNPTIPVGKQITEAIIKNQKVSRDEAKKRAVEMLKLVGIPDAEQRYGLQPHFFSGATRDLLVNVLKYHPFLVKPNNHELGEIFGVELKNRQDVIPYGKKLQEKGARNVLISMAGEGAVLVAENGQVFEKPAPKGTLVNGVGAGDSMVAGFMAGWMEKQDHEYAFHMGISAGSASAFSENLATREEVQAVYEQVTEG